MLNHLQLITICLSRNLGNFLPIKSSSLGRLTTIFMVHLDTRSQELDRCGIAWICSKGSGKAQNVDKSGFGQQQSLREL
uniref:Uncharacterized protein n=1 Tax=Physcomitrium patens TaxID=3218 RepID=A0A7I3ZBK5_PHYPA